VEGSRGGAPVCNRLCVRPGRKADYKSALRRETRSPCRRFLPSWSDFTACHFNRRDAKDAARRSRKFEIRDPKSEANSNKWKWLERTNGAGNFVAACEGLWLLQCRESSAFDLLRVFCVSAVLFHLHPGGCPPRFARCGVVRAFFSPWVTGQAAKPRSLLFAMPASGSRRPRRLWPDRNGWRPRSHKVHDTAPGRKPGWACCPGR
jgi:hypothetical protein